MEKSYDLLKRKINNMNNELTKKKNNLLKAIMSNPKLAKTFKEALSAPIGSTKRAQAKSVISIMRKIGGVTNDGQGGPLNIPQNNTPVSAVPTAPNYGNMVIFPAAPKFKVKKPVIASTPTPKTNDGQGGEYNFDFTNPPATNIFGTSNQEKTYEAPPAQPFVNPFKGAGDYLVNAYKDNYGTFVDTVTGISALTPFQPKPGIQFKGALSPYGTMPQSTPTIMGDYGTPAKDSANFAGGVLAPTIGVTVTPGSTGSTGSKTGFTSVDEYNKKWVEENPWANMPPDKDTDSSTKTGILNNYGVNDAIKSGIGSTAYAMDFANQRFGGSIDQYITNLDAKLKKDFNLAPLETELTNLKSQGANLVPTLQNFMKGKDQYLSFIDKMIEQTEGSRSTTDMGNPAEANFYNNYLNYLYTLKGRQNQRYGNFLNSAIADYNADLTRVQSNYETTYKNYENAITRQGTIAQNEYNNLMTRMASLYTEVENAPMKAQNLIAITQQNENNALILAQSAAEQAGKTDPNYYKNLPIIQKNLLDKDDKLDLTKIGSEGLRGLIDEVKYGGVNPEVVTTVLSTGMAKLMDPSTATVNDFNTVHKLIKDLSLQPGYGRYARTLSDNLAKSSYNTVSQYVLSNAGTIKKAINELPKKPDLASWISNNKGVDKGVLENIYNIAQRDNPATFIQTIYGEGDSVAADRITDMINSY